MIGVIRQRLLLMHFLCLILGGITYLMFRPVSLLMFDWVEYIGLSPLLAMLRDASAGFRGRLNDNLIFSLPGGLWMASAVSLFLYIWDSRIQRGALFWALLMLFLSVGSELAQKVGLIPGTYDMIDIGFYLIGFIFPFLFTTNHSYAHNEN